MWSVYIIRCADDTLYTGISTAVDRRLREHAVGGPRAARYLRGRGPLRLVYACAAGDRAAALRIEHRLKKLSKEAKEMLIAGTIALDALHEDAHDR